MRILSVVGARPQFVKLAPLDRASRESGHDHIIVHTGQHYDAAMSESFFVELGIGAPAHNLEVGSASHGAQTGRMIEALESVYLAEKPDVVLLYGDTNSTLAGAIAAAKLHLPIAHLEAGLRSWNRRMPEEHNRVLTDHSSDLCLAPTEVAVSNLAAEGLADRTVLVGDIMADVCLDTYRRVSGGGNVPNEMGAGARAGYLATIHRADNTDDKKKLQSILNELSELDDIVTLAAHPRLASRIDSFGLDINPDRVTLVKPRSYPSMILAVAQARAVITDSGGLQKECFLLRTPCVTVRSETEWSETVELGWNILAEPGHIRRALGELTPSETSAAPYGEGNTAGTVIRELESFLTRYSG